MWALLGGGDCPSSELLYVPPWSSNTTFIYMKTGGLCNQADPHILSVYLLWPVLYAYMQWSDRNFFWGGQPSWDDDVICSLALLLALMLYRLWKNSVLSCCAGSPCHWLLFRRTRERFSKLLFIHLKEILKAFYSANDRMMLYFPKRIENIVSLIDDHLAVSSNQPVWHRFNRNVWSSQERKIKFLFLCLFVTDWMDTNMK